jgi:PTH1 family peptidyl-tRNA hydrolase
MRLIAGLGNPGPKYERHRHNVGFMSVDAIVRRHAFAPYRARFHALAADGVIAGEKVIALKPMTYMNDSGRAVGAALRFYKLDPAALVVIHDEIDLVFGKLRVKRNGGNAGHNGLRSLDAHIGPDYWRVRVGVGHPGERHLVMPFLLHDFGKEESAFVGRMVEAIAEALPLLIAGDEGQFMNRVAVLINPPRPKREPAPPAPNPDSLGQSG